MRTIQQNNEFARYVSVDIETAGPNPAEYALLSVGACLVEDPSAGFYVELQPDRQKADPAAMAIHNLSLQELAIRGLPPAEALRRFAAWLEARVPGRTPIFVAFNAPFDWMFVNDYFHRYLGENPFGHTALDIKAFYMGRFQVSWQDTRMGAVSKHFLDNRPLAHNALQDAQDQAELFLRMLAEGPSPPSARPPSPEQEI